MSDQAFVKAFSRRRPKQTATPGNSGPQAGSEDLAVSQASSNLQPSDSNAPVPNPPAPQAAGTAVAGTAVAGTTGEDVQGRGVLNGDAAPTETDSVNRSAAAPRAAGVEPGSMQLDESVASTARIWVDPIEDQMARADYASTEVPRPHLESISADAPEYPSTATPEIPPTAAPVAPDADPTDRDPAPSDCEMAGSGNEDQVVTDCEDTSARNDADAVDPLQHIHTAYASAYADASVLAEIHSFAIEPEPTALPEPIAPQREPIPVREPETAPAPNASAQEFATEIDSENLFRAPTAEIPAPPASAQADSVSSLPLDDTQEHPVYLPSEESQQEPLEIAPFQAVWEVDVFDVPTPVADLFFEGTLFQQIAERMSEAVGSGLSSVLVTSTKAGEGRSSVAIGIAMAAAATGIRVALVDADTDDPTLADDLRLELQYGWVDTVRGGLPIKEVAVHAVEDGVTLIPLMPPSGRNAATAFELVQLVEMLKDKFELVIIDGPTAQSAHIHQGASIVDSAIIVRDMARTDTLAINEFSYRLRESGVLGVGVVENFV